MEGKGNGKFYKVIMREKGRLVSIMGGKKYKHCENIRLAYAIGHTTVPKMPNSKIFVFVSLNDAETFLKLRFPEDDIRQNPYPLKYTLDSATHYVVKWLSRYTQEIYYSNSNDKSKTPPGYGQHKIKGCWYFIGKKKIQRSILSFRLCN